MKHATPRLLGLAGLLPFIGLAMVVALDLAGWSPAASQALMVYSALILSFLGGIGWGAALRQERGSWFLFSMAPFFAAWAALTIPREIGLWLLIAAFLAALATDRSASQAGLLPHWFMDLRRPLTAVVVLSLLIAALGMGA